jgi:hypothetical protein
MAHWVTLATRLLAQGVSVVLPWGSPAEQSQAQAIADQGGRAPGAAAIVVAPRLSLAVCASLLAGARMVAGSIPASPPGSRAGPAGGSPVHRDPRRFGPYWSPCAARWANSGSGRSPMRCWLR